MDINNNSQKKRILIIDDNKRIHLDFKKILLITKEKEENLDKLEEALLGKKEKQIDETFIVDSAFQGEEGLKMVEESVNKGEPYAVAFVDVRMPPGWNGIETISRIWKVYPDLQIVICTAYSDYSWKEIIEKLGYSDKLLILKKPFDNIEVRQLTYSLSKKWELNRIADLKMSDLEKNVEERTRELNEIKERYQNLYDYAPDMYFSVRPDGIVLSVNKSGAEYLGYTKDELIGKPVWIVVFPDDLKGIQKHISEIFSKKLIKSKLEFRKVRKDGSIIWVRERTYLFLDDKGNPKELLVMCRDITERKKIEKELQASEEKYRTMIEHSNDMIWTLDKKGNFLYVNKKSEEITEYKLKEGIGTSFAPLIVEEDLEKVNKVFKDTMDGNPHQYEVRIYNSSRTKIITLSVNTAPILKDGKVIGTVSFGRDITEQKRAENALKQSELKYRTTINSMGDLLHVVDSNLRISLCNTALTKINKRLGLETDVIGRTVPDVFPFLPQKVYDEYKKVFETGKTLVTEEGNKIKNTEFITETRKIPIFEGEKVDRVVTIVRDISEKKKAAKALLESEEKLRNFVESATVGIWCFRTETPIDIMASEEKIIKEFLKAVCAECNETYAKMMGTTKEDILGVHLSEIMPDTPENKEYLTDFIRNGFRLPVGVSYEVNKKNEKKYFSNSMVGKIKSGKLIETWGTQTDITKEKKAVDELRQVSKEREEIFQALGNATIIIDPEFKIMAVNRASKALVNKSEEELVGKKCYEIFYRTNQPPESCPVKQMLASKLYEPVEKEMETLYGTFLISATPLLDDTGHLVKIIHASTDITERKHLEEMITHRIVALTQPTGKLSELKFTDMIDIETLQKLQDNFAELNNIASVIFDTNGEPITKYSNFSKFCQIVRSTENGLKRCKYSGASLGEKAVSGTIGIESCGNIKEIMDAVIPIIIQGQHIANWGIGQAVCGKIEEDEVREFARKIGASEEDLIQASKELVKMSKEKFKKILDFLKITVDQISLLSLRNFQQSRLITERKEIEAKLKKRNEELNIFNKIAVGRELKMVELKKKINKLLKDSGKKPQY